MIQKADGHIRLQVTVKKRDVKEILKDYTNVENFIVFTCNEVCMDLLLGLNVIKRFRGKKRFR